MEHPAKLFSAKAEQPSKTPEELIKEADALSTNKKFSTKLVLYKQAAEKGSTLALVRLGDLYRESFTLRRETVEAYIKTNNITDMSQLKLTLDNNKLAFDYYIQSWHASEKEPDKKITLQQQELAKNGVRELLEQMKACHKGLLLAFFNKISAKDIKTLKESFNILVADYQQATPKMRLALFSKEKIINNAHVAKYNFRDNTLALFGARFLAQFLNIEISNYTDSSTNHNLIELGSFFLTLLNARISNNSSNIRITTTTAEIIGKYFVTHKAKLLAAMPIDKYELEKEKSKLKHGEFILQLLIKTFWEGATGITFFMYILASVAQTEEFNLQNLALPAFDQETDFGVVANKFLDLIKQCEIHQSQAHYIADAADRMRQTRITN